MNLFYWLYDYFFINHTIDEQDAMHRADLILLSIYKKKLQTVQKNI